jgi:predicted nucleic acid-binding Zn ribbon protein
MKRIYEFVCESGHRIERLCDYEAQTTQCECGGSANRTLSAPAFRLEGWSGSFPSAHGRFEKSHLDKLKAERKATT